MLVYGYIALGLGVAWLLGNMLCRWVIGKAFELRLVHRTVLLLVCVILLQFVLALAGLKTIVLATLPVLVAFVAGGVLFSYYFGRCLSYFPTRAAMASAAMGGTFSVIAALATLAASHLKAVSLVPLAACYLFIACLILLCRVRVRYST